MTGRYMIMLATLKTRSPKLVMHIYYPVVNTYSKWVLQDLSMRMNHI